MFDSDFLLWIIMNFRNRNFELDDNFRILKLSDLSTAGDERGDYIGRKISTEKSINVSQSIPMLFTLLSGREPIYCKFAFIIDDYSGTIKISNDGKISILHSFGILKLVSPIERIIISLHFVLRLVDLYEKWKNLELNLKYPSREDFLNIIHDCREMGMRFYDIQDIIEKYRRKRKNSV